MARSCLYGDLVFQEIYFFKGLVPLKGSFTSSLKGAQSGDRAIRGLSVSIPGPGCELRGLTMNCRNPARPPTLHTYMHTQLCIYI